MRAGRIEELNIYVYVYNFCSSRSSAIIITLSLPRARISTTSATAATSCPTNPRVSFLKPRGCPRPLSRRGEKLIGGLLDAILGYRMFCHGVFSFTDDLPENFEFLEDPFFSDDSFRDPMDARAWINKFNAEYAHAFSSQ